MKKFLLLSSFLIVLMGCGPRLIYPHLEWLIPWYVSDYISLDDTQKNMLQKRLLRQLDWHCRTQLPAYAESLRAIGRDFADAERPINYAKIRFHINNLIALYHGLLKQIGPDIHAILIAASDAQIAELFDNLKKQNQEFKAIYVNLPIQQLNENRQKRSVKRLKYWISNLTDGQKEAISAWSSQLVPTAKDWLQNREILQTEARRLLSRRGSSPEFRATLLEIIVNPDQLRTPAYQAKIAANIDMTIRFIIRLDRLITPQQRSYLLKRIESLAADFDKLSCDPREVPRPGAGDEN